MASYNQYLLRKTCIVTLNSFQGTLLFDSSTVVGLVQSFI